MLSTPAKITPKILELCARIQRRGKPRFVSVVVGTQCEPLDCFANVKHEVEARGGHLQFGWAIWEWPNVYIEAEHHAVYAPPDGAPWVDITPHVMGAIDQRLFLPDDNATYDFEREGTRRDNVRMALSNDSLIKRLFEVAQEESRIYNSIEGVGQVTTDMQTATTLRTLQQENARLSIQLAAKHTPPNARCFCGSGAKFKKCHGRRP